MDEKTASAVFFMSAFRFEKGVNKPKRSEEFMEILKYQDWKDEQLTLHLITQILGKYKIACAYQRPQWEHVTLDITTEGLTTGILYVDDKHFSIDINLLDDLIEVRVNHEKTSFTLEDGKTVQDYFKQIKGTLDDYDIKVQLNPAPQEMENKIPLDEDTTHHHYNHDVAVKALELMQYAERSLKRFIHPLRARTAGPAFFWGTFDISAIIVNNKFHEEFKPAQVIEYGAFDEEMIEFGFWFGGGDFAGPTYFVLPYPFVNKDFTFNESLPEGARFDQTLTEFVYELQRGDLRELDTIKAVFESGYAIFGEHLNWPNLDHSEVPMHMPPNLHTNKDA